MTAPNASPRPSAPPWASGVVTGLETVIMSAGLVLAFAFAAVAAAPSIDGSIAADWSGASDVATSVWLLAHGVPATAGAIVITLVPLGLTLITVVLAASVARRYAVAAHASVFSAGLAYGAVVGAVAVLEHAGRAASIRAAMVGALACGVGTSMGLARAHGFRFWGELRLPSSVAAGLRLGAGATGLSAVAALATAVAWMLAGWDRSASIAIDLDPDPVGGVALGVAETAYVPNLASWALSWLTGVGFALGEGSHYSPSAVTERPAPAVPLLGALPLASGGALAAVPVVLVVVGFVARRASSRWMAVESRGVVTQVVGVIVVGVAGWASAVASSGSIGGGALTIVGAPPLQTAVALAALVGIGCALGSIGARSRRINPTNPNPNPSLPSTAQSAPPRPAESPPRTEPQRLW